MPLEKVDPMIVPFCSVEVKTETRVLRLNGTTLDLLKHRPICLLPRIG